MEKRTLVSSPTNTKQVYKTTLHIKPPKQVVGGTVLIKNGPVPDLSGNAFRFSLRMFAMGLLFIAFIMSGKVFSLTTFWSVFSVCVKAFSVSERHVKHKEQQRSVGCFPEPHSAWRFGLHIICTLVDSRLPWQEGSICWLWGLNWFVIHFAFKETSQILPT